jgi:hypothetical protein
MIILIRLPRWHHYDHILVSQKVIGEFGPINVALVLKEAITRTSMLISCVVAC